MNKPEPSINEDNIKTVECKSWESFKKALIAIDEKNSHLRGHGNILKQTDGVPYFRGQADANWRLESTLERLGRNYDVLKYYRLLSTIHNNLITCGILNVPEFNVPANKISAPLPESKFLCFVRHLGFPSPLLDWSRSPFVASFFAFSQCNESATDKVALYVLFNSKTKQGCSDCEHDMFTTIELMGKNIQTHKRHFIQQSNYTYAITGKEFGEAQCFISHAKCLKSDAEFDFNNCRIHKYILPASEKNVVLKDLDAMNINAYSLYGTDEALMETLFNREVLFKD